MVQSPSFLKYNEEIATKEMWTLTTLPYVSHTLFLDSKSSTTGLSVYWIMHHTAPRVEYCF